MASGYALKLKRQRQLHCFAKDLVRRSRSKCELCGSSGQKLKIYEVEHDSEFTDANHCIFICEHCFDQIEAPKKVDPLRWYFLNTAIWSDVPAVQVTAARMLKRLSKSQPWAADLLEETYIEDEIHAWISLADA